MKLTCSPKEIEEKMVVDKIIERPVSRKQVFPPWLPGAEVSLAIVLFLTSEQLLMPSFPHTLRLKYTGLLRRNELSLLP